MATMNALQTHIYLLPDSGSKRDSSPENIRVVALFVNGPTAAMTLFLPTVDLHEPGVVLPNQFHEYISDIQGYALSRCDVSVHQRHLLLHLLLGYRAFYNGVLPTDPDAYPIFVALIADTAASADDHKAADDVIVEIVAWLHTVFPEEVFSDDSIPLLNHNAPEEPKDHPPSPPTGSTHKSTVQPGAAPDGPTSGVKSDADQIFVAHVLTNDPGFAQIFPEGMPKRLLQAILGAWTPKGIVVETATARGDVTYCNGQRLWETGFSKLYIKRYKEDA
ncbi:hypothetical protein C8T65DRAFT_750731 [Cerioporus squamosus]|nr:hypothetical protein C8T65DRAFT_750731 [Cerioporus squamosus]